MDAIVAHLPLDPLIAGREASHPQLANHAWDAIGFFKLDVNRADQGRHLSIAQPLAIRLAASLPGPIAANADVKHVEQFGECKGLDSHTGHANSQATNPHSAEWINIQACR